MSARAPTVRINCPHELPAPSSRMFLHAPSAQVRTSLSKAEEEQQQQLVRHSTVRVPVSVPADHFSVCFRAGELCLN